MSALTTLEYDYNYQRAMSMFASYFEKDAARYLYRMDNSFSRTKGDLVFLFTWAINIGVPKNYLCDTHLTAIISKLNAMQLETCNCNSSGVSFASFITAQGSSQGTGGGGGGTTQPINEVIPFTDEESIIVPWNTTRRARFGDAAVFMIEILGEDNVYRQTSAEIIPNDVNNTTSYTINLGGTSTGRIIIS